MLVKVIMSNICVTTMAEQLGKYTGGQSIRAREIHEGSIYETFFCGLSTTKLLGEGGFLASPLPPITSIKYQNLKTYRDQLNAHYPSS